MIDHLTDLQTSRRFQEAGVEKESIYLWCEENGNVRLVHRFFQPVHETETKYPAYLLSELLEMVGCVYSLSAGGITLLLGHKGQQYRDQTFHGNPIQAVAEAILWQKGQEKEDREELNKEVYCHACSVAGGADCPIFHLPPVCKGGKP